MSEALQSIFASFGIEFDPRQNLRQGQSQVDKLTESLGDFGRTLTAAFAFYEAREFVRQTVEIGDTLADTSEMLGVTSDELQRWQYVARMSGAEVGEFTSAFTRLQNRMAQGGAGAAVFRRLGVDIRDANGDLRNASDVLSDLANPIAALSTDAERTGVLVDLLGRSGARLGPLFSRGAEGIAEVQREFDRLGGGMSEDAVEAAAQYQDAMDRLDVTLMTLRGNIAVLVLPALEATAGVLQELYLHSHILEGAVVAFGLAAVQVAVASYAAWAPVVAEWAMIAGEVLAAAAPFILLGLVVDDVITLFSGGQSVIGDFVDALFGVGAAQELVEGVNLAVDDLIANVRVLVDWIGERFRGALESVADSDAYRAVTGFFSQFEGGDMGQTAINAAGAVEDAVFGRAPGMERAATRGLDPSGARVLAGGVVPAQRGGTQVTVGRIDASGLTPEQAERVVTRAVDRAITQANSDALDALAGGAR